ncbi:MAG: methyltransferase domain-containing protein [Deltaproteobacteria bacterium]|nr:methyltransferase domain-containing protein [Deltaproteobacteria bacterium]
MPGWNSLLDLGCGCGAVALSALLRLPGDTIHAGRRLMGLDKFESLVEATRRNAALLGLEDMLKAEVADLTQEEEFSRLKSLPAFGPGGSGVGFDLVVANPPYRLHGQGRLPVTLERGAALFGGLETLRAFVRFARMSVRTAREDGPGGIFCLSFPWARRQELAREMIRQSFRPERMLPVSAKPGRTPFMLLLEARAATPDSMDSDVKCVINMADICEDTLFLYEAAKGQTRPSERALALCPRLKPSGPQHLGWRQSA